MLWAGAQGRPRRIGKKLHRGGGVWSQPLWGGMFVGCQVVAFEPMVLCIPGKHCALSYPQPLSWVLREDVILGKEEISHKDSYIGPKEFGQSRGSGGFLEWGAALRTCASLSGKARWVLLSSFVLRDMSLQCRETLVEKNLYGFRVKYQRRVCRITHVPSSMHTCVPCEVFIYLLPD